MILTYRNSFRIFNEHILSKNQNFFNRIVTVLRISIKGVLLSVSLAFLYMELMHTLFLTSSIRFALTVTFSCRFTKGWYIRPSVCDHSIHMTVFVPAGLTVLSPTNERPSWIAIEIMKANCERPNIMDLMTNICF